MRIMPIGIVKDFDDAKGFGFIGRRHGADLYVHHSKIMHQIGRKTLKIDDEVTFEIANTRNGPIAINVWRSSLAR